MALLFMVALASSNEVDAQDAFDVQVGTEIVYTYDETGYPRRRVRYEVRTPQSPGMLSIWGTMDGQEPGPVVYRSDGARDLAWRTQFAGEGEAWAKFPHSVGKGWFFSYVKTLPSGAREEHKGRCDVTETTSLNLAGQSWTANLVVCTDQIVGRGSFSVRTWHDVRSGIILKQHRRWGCCPVPGGEAKFELVQYTPPRALREPPIATRK